MTYRTHRPEITAPALALTLVLALAGPGFGQAAGRPTPAPNRGAGATNNAVASVSRPYVTSMIGELDSVKTAPDTPRTVADLKAIQDRVEVIARHALPAIVNIRVSDGQGSGVIVSRDGYVLTAGHVSGTPNQPVRIRLSNGTTVDGVSLGNNNQVDSGMVKITTPGDYSCMPVGSIKDLREGEWVMAMGHPGGYQAGRQPVVRLGKTLKVVANNREWFVQSDCPLIMGDSGGPVFDLNGFVIGINSKIGLKNTSNVHVPIDAFTQSWDRLAKGDEWGNTGILSLLAGSNAAPTSQVPKAAIGALGRDAESGGVLITTVIAGKAADRAGIQRDDVLTKVNGQVIKSYDEFKNLMAKMQPEQSVAMDLLRGTKLVHVNVTLDAAESR